MLIRPEFKQISRLSQLPNIKETRRNIVIYTKNSLDTSKCEIAIFNNSIQFGNIGGIQSKHEILYAVNCYYGEVEMPLCVSSSTKELTINKEAIVRIKGFGYINKLIDNFSLISETKNFFDDEFHGDRVTYRNGTDEMESPLPPDPRFYNLDQQLVMTGGCTNPFYVNEGDMAQNLLIDIVMREGGGIGYRLGDLIDEFTVVRTMDVKISDPYNVMETNGKEFRFFTTDTLSTISNYGMLCFLDEYHVFVDYKLGYNATNLKRKFNQMNKSDERTEVCEFFHNLQQVWENMKEENFKIRYTLVYKDFKANVSIMPIDKDPYKGNVAFNDPEIVDYIEDYYNQL